VRALLVVDLRRADFFGEVLVLGFAFSFDFFIFEVHSVFLFAELLELVC
jgi:hypothetical protein